jgi:hypothetical protein
VETSTRDGTRYLYNMTSYSWNHVKAEECFCTEEEASQKAKELAESATSRAFADQHDRNEYVNKKASWTVGYCRKKLSELEQSFDYYEKKLKTLSSKRKKETE